MKGSGGVRPGRTFRELDCILHDIVNTSSEFLELTRLKHAYDAQRSLPFLIVADERSARFAGKRLTGSFHEIWEVITVIGVGDLQRLYEALKSQQALLEKINAKQ